MNKRLRNNLIYLLKQANKPKGSYIVIAESDEYAIERGLVLVLKTVHIPRGTGVMPFSVNMYKTTMKGVWWLYCNNPFEKHK